MRNKILTVACSLAVLSLSALTATTVACPKDKETVAKSDAQPTAIVKVVDSKSQCSTSKKARTASKLVAADKAACKSGKAPAAPTATAVVADASSCCPAGTAAMKAVKAASCETTCPSKRTKMLVKSMNELSKCGPDCAPRQQVLAALTTLAKEKPDAVCEVLISNMTCSPAAAPAVAVASSSKQCGTQKAKTVAAGDKAACGSKAKATQVAAGAACDPAACAKAKTTKVASGQKACGGAVTPANYVAFGCDKSDRVARAAARAYLNIMRELKSMSGAEGCAGKASTELLASVLDQMQGERTAQAETTEPVVETATVSFGAVSDKKSSCGSKN